MDPAQTLQSLQSLGFTMPSAAYLIGAVIFSIIGFIAYRYGKKTSHKYVKWLGVVLMFYPYAVSSTWLLYGVGIGLCGACYYYRQR